MSEINGLPGSGNVSSVFHSSAGSSERSLGRGERRSRASSPAPFCLRLTFEERAALEALAGSMPLGAYIREKLLNGAEAQRRKRRKPLQDEQALARLLAELGNSRLANNLNQLATAANTGSLPVAPETVQAILSACQDVREMRTCLIAALGLAPEPPR